ncbi:MAG: hypothetical protein K9J30_00535 [Bacteroidales bacterium]|nr:hypothetical protein [Bacteroidales bacterium]
MKSHTTKFTRREFIGTSTVASGAIAFAPGPFLGGIFGDEFTIKSAVYSTVLNVKMVHTGVIHEEAYEGSCRVGNVEYLTMEHEQANMKRGLAELKSEVAGTGFGPGINILDPQGVYMWVEAGNPEIMLKDEELHKLNSDSDVADVYVVAGGLPQFTCVRIAETYKKPVVFMSPAGWGLDVPGGIRAMGYDSFYVADMEYLKNLLMVFKARKAFQNTRFLNVTNFDVVPKGVISSVNDLDFIREKYGMSYQTVDYKEFFNEMDKLEKDKSFMKKAEKLAEQLMEGAGRYNMTGKDVMNSFLYYLTVLHFFEQYDCNAFGVECFELCSSMQPWNRRFTPCMTHSLLKNDGFPSACEKDLNALLSMASMMYVSNKPAYMGNPDFEHDKSIIKLHHSDSPTKMKGFGEKDDYYEIKSFTDSGFGATLRYDYAQHKGQKVTLARFNPSGTKMLLMPGAIADGGGMEGIGCAQTVSIEVNNSKESMRAMQDFGHHLSMVYGDCSEQIRDLGELMDFGVQIV